GGQSLAWLAWCRPHQPGQLSSIVSPWWVARQWPSKRYCGTVRLVVLLIVALGMSVVGVAKDVSPAKPDLTCKKQADCGFTHYDHECCWRCGARIGNATWVADVEAYCQAHPSKSCPHPSCGQAFVQI